MSSGFKNQDTAQTAVLKMIHAIPISGINIDCCHGWGWTRRESEETELKDVETLAEFHVNSGLLYTLDEEARMITVTLNSDFAGVGTKCVIIPLHSGVPSVVKRFEFCVLLFGEKFLPDFIHQAITRAEQRLPQFEYPETRGYAVSVTFLSAAEKSKVPD